MKERFLFKTKHFSLFVSLLFLFSIATVSAIPNPGHPADQIDFTVPINQLIISSSSGRQLHTNNWADMSSHSGGQGFFAGNAYLDESDNSYRYANTHATIGAAGFAVNSPAWNKAGIFVNNGPSTAGGTFIPNWVATFQSDGYVGIGTTSPQQKLDVNGTVRGQKFEDDNPLYYVDMNVGGRFKGLTVDDSIVGSVSGSAGSVPWSGVSSKPAFANNAVSGRVRMYESGCASGWGSSCDADQNGWSDYADTAPWSGISGRPSNIIGNYGNGIQVGSYYDDDPAYYVDMNVGGRFKGLTVDDPIVGSVSGSAGAVNCAGITGTTDNVCVDNYAADTNTQCDDYDCTVSSMYANNWFRSNGQTGWYSQTYGGGIRMIDSTWVRVYNNKRFLVNNIIRGQKFEDDNPAYYVDMNVGGRFKALNIDNTLTAGELQSSSTIKTPSGARMHVVSGEDIYLIPYYHDVYVYCDDNWCNPGSSRNGADLHVSERIYTNGCTGCSVLAEMTPIGGDFNDGDVICINKETGNNERCFDDKLNNFVGIAAVKAEQILRANCAGDGAGGDSLVIGGSTIKELRENPDCNGWYPIALAGLLEGANVVCERPDGSSLQHGDRLVTSDTPGHLRPLMESENGGDAIVGKAQTKCAPGKATDKIHVWIR